MFVQALPSMSFCQSIRKCLSNYCSFSGRARRSEFWFFYLFVDIISLLPFYIMFSKIFDYIVENMSFLNNYAKQKDDNGYVKRIPFSTRFYTAGIAYLIINIIFIFPFISVMVRRLHDIGKSGAYSFMLLIPCGSSFLFTLLSQDSQKETNQYGPSPKYIIIQNDAPLMNNCQLFQ